MNRDCARFVREETAVSARFIRKWSNSLGQWSIRAGKSLLSWARGFVRKEPMCRWIAYRGETITLERYVTAPAHSLVVQSIRSLEASGPTNGDGFGLGWYDQHDAEPGLYREERPAWSDENLRHLCRHIGSHRFFAYVRASTGTATTRPNCHPFAHGRWMFMHNGQFGDWSLIRRQAEALIPDAFYRSRVGTTDSAALFLRLLGAGADEDPVGATVGTLAAVTDIVRASGTADPVRFTAALRSEE